jgi:hypothetical protein
MLTLLNLLEHFGTALQRFEQTAVSGVCSPPTLIGKRLTAVRLSLQSPAVRIFYRSLIDPLGDLNSRCAHVSLSLVLLV